MLQKSFVLYIWCSLGMTAKRSSSWKYIFYSIIYQCSKQLLLSNHLLNNERSTNLPELCCSNVCSSELLVEESEEFWNLSGLKMATSLSHHESRDRTTTVKSSNCPPQFFLSPSKSQPSAKHLYPLSV